MRTGTCDWCGDGFEDRSPAQTKRFCSENCRKRYQDHTTGRGTCSECGGPTSAGSKTQSARKGWVCASCSAKATEKFRRAILDGYRQGLTAYEISERTGYPVLSICVEACRMRRRGIAVPKAPTGTPSHRRNREAA